MVLFNKVVDVVPGSLHILNETASAQDNDVAHATTITNAVPGKPIILQTRTYSEVLFCNRNIHSAMTTTTKGVNSNQLTASGSIAASQLISGNISSPTDNVLIIMCLVLPARRSLWL